MSSTFSDSISTASTTLLNASECLPHLEQLSEKFDVIYFLDLCAAVEAAILYDELHITAVSAGGNQILEPLAQAGVLHDARLKGDPIELTKIIFAQPRAAELMRRLEQVNYIHYEDMDLAITATVAAAGLPLDLAIEESTDKTLTLPFRQLPIYLSIPTVQKERHALYKAKLSLAERYPDLRATMLAFRHEEAFFDLDHLELPPLALETLTKATTFDELGEIIMDQRRRYAKLRNRFRNVRELYASPDYTPIERYTEKKKLDEDMKRLSERVRSVPAVLTLNDIEKASEAIAPAAVTHDLTKLGKLLGPIANWIDERMFRWRMRPLVGLIELYTGTTVRQIAEASKVLFKHELTTADVTRAKRYADIVKKYVPARVP